MDSNSAFKTYLFSYQHDGASWVLELKAATQEDAMRRLSKLQYATYDGHLIAKIGAPAGITALFSPLLTFLSRVGSLVKR